MEVIKSWKNNDINKYYIITRDKETNEWKFFKEIVGHTVFWKDEPSHYGMTKSKAIELLNVIKKFAEMPENKNNIQHKIVRLSSVTYNGEDVGMINGNDYLKLKSTMYYIDNTFNDNIHVVVAENVESIENTDDPEHPNVKRTSVFYFYLSDASTWFLELKTDIDYALVSHITTLDDIKELL